MLRLSSTTQQLIRLARPADGLLGCQARARHEEALPQQAAKMSRQGSRALGSAWAS
ncbi:MAG: hypothetical protein ACRYG7_26170 [Janthinobacterium lividum]